MPSESIERKGRDACLLYQPSPICQKPLRCQAKQDVTHAEFFGTQLLTSFGETIISNIKPPGNGGFLSIRKTLKHFWEKRAFGRI